MKPNPQQYLTWFVVTKGITYPGRQKLSYISVTDQEMKVETVNGIALHTVQAKMHPSHVGE